MKNEFEVTGDKLIVSDPCYDRNVWCRGELGPVARGTWYGSLDFRNQGSWGNRVAQLEVRHSSYNKWETSSWQTAPFEVGVDSGQAGVFDEARYPEGPGTGPEFEYKDRGSFYGRACAATHNGKKLQGGAIDEGFVSSSGYGDGSYECRYATNKDGLIVAVQITFIGEDEDEEDDE